MNSNINKNCLLHLNKKCLNRIDKHLTCCIDDINDELEILNLTIDKIHDSINSFNISKETFSRTMFVADILNSQNDCDRQIVFEIKRVSYFLYNAENSESWHDLSISLLKEIFKWFQAKTSGLIFDSTKCNIYLSSLTSDINTVFNLLAPDSTSVPEYIDDIFF